MPAASDAAASPAEFLFHTRIRFHQADPAGVLFFGRVTELLQAAYEELVADMGLDHRAHFAQHETSTPIAHLEIDYHRPIQAGEDITVRVRVARIGSRSFTLAFGLDDEDGQRRVSAETVFVFTLIEGERFLPAPLPEDLRARLARYQVVDSA